MSSLFFKTMEGMNKMDYLQGFYDGTLAFAEVVEQKRDLTLFKISHEFSLMIACDSDGGIGNKEHDFVKVENWLTGYFGARVALMEILAAKGRPWLLIDTLAVEMDPAGKEIISGIRKACAEAGVHDLPLTGSTEDNIPTVQTGIGVTVLAIVKNDQIPVGSSQKGDLVAVAGIPKSGPQFQVEPEDPELISLQDLWRLREIPGVHDILPVGSKGVAYEAGELAKSAGLQLRLGETDLDLLRSGGPATSVVFSLLNNDVLQTVKEAISAPIKLIGELY